MMSISLEIQKHLNQSSFCFSEEEKVEFERIAEIVVSDAVQIYKEKVHRMEEVGKARRKWLKFTIFWSGIFCG